MGLFQEKKKTFLAFLNNSSGRATVVTLGSASVSVSKLDGLVKDFYVMGKVLSDKLSCTRTGLVQLYYSKLMFIFAVILKG
ncbi:MAG: hypothetical protein AB2693_31370 [Candidatus Thiodiazotropha sp.]